MDASVEAPFRLVVEHAPNAMVVVDRRGTILMVNAQAERVFGYSRAELFGQPVEILVPERFRGQHAGMRVGYFADLRARTMGAGRDLYAVRKDGGEFPVEIGFNPVDTDEGTMVLASIIDITERKTAEMALRESEHRSRSLAAIVESSNDAIISVGLDGLVISWNKAAERIFGNMAAEMIGQPILRLAAPGREAEMMEILSRIGRGERVDHYETIRRHKNGSLLHVSLSESPVFDIDGQLIGASKVLRDITKRKAAEMALRESQARLQEVHSELLHASRLSAMGQTLAMVTHELNHPLTVIANYMEMARMLLDREAEPPIARVREMLDRAGEQALRAGEMIERLRRFLSVGEIEKRMEAVSPLVRDAAELARVDTKYSGIEIRIDDRADNAAVMADRIQLQQVLLNLLRNGAEAVADQERPQVWVLAEMVKDTVRISIIDNGPGLPVEVSERLFQPFVTTKETGLGIGLSICKSIVDAHDGRLWTKPNPDGGTVFCLALPVAISC